MDAAGSLATKLGNAKQGGEFGNEWSCKCPLHDDHKNSLSITEKEGKILVKCHAGCGGTEILQWCNDKGYLPKNGHQKDIPIKKSIIETYEYTNADGDILFEKIRYSDKSFGVKRIDKETGKVVFNSGGHAKTLYKRHTLNNLSGVAVVITEGEKDCNFIIDNYQIIATTPPNGAGSWNKAFIDVFAGAKVIICPDNDAPGLKMAYQIADDLLPVASTVKIVIVPTGKDISDWRGSKYDFRKLIIGTDYYVKKDDGRANEKVNSTHNETLDSDNKYCDVDLLQHLPDGHILKRLAIQTSLESSIPVNTTLLMGLGVFSSVACRNWCVEYEYSGILPIGLYTIGEQPPGTGKGRVLHKFSDPFQETLDALIIKRDGRISELMAIDKQDQTDDEKKELKSLVEKKIVLFITNATAEGLEMTLGNTNGHFSCVSSEQGLLDVLLGMAYGKGNANNNDVILNGFDGGHVSFFRVLRQAYTGKVSGSVVCFAQQGSVEKVLNSSNGTGLSERFLLIAENHFLGKRDHSIKYIPDKALEYEYSKSCAFAEYILSEPEKPKKNLLISKKGWRLIEQYQNYIEPQLSDGGIYSHSSLRGSAAKINMQIMKIAANLYLIDGNCIHDIIPDECILSAIGIAGELLNASLTMCKSKGVMGRKAEYESILSLFEKDLRPRTERNILQVKLKTKPFCDFSGNKSNLVRKSLQEMVIEGLIKESWTVDGIKLYSMGQ
jgi:hypothetical protein